MATASDTPRMALAPSRALFGVPSRSISSVVDRHLLGRLDAADGFQNLAFDIGDGLQHALAAEAGVVAVAQFDGLMRAGGGA